LGYRLPPEQERVQMEQLLSYHRRIFAGCSSWLVLLAGILFLLPESAFAEYRLQSGDTLEIAIAGLPDLRQRAAIGLDGAIALPLAGQTKVRGLSISEAREQITLDLSNKIYRQITNDGREIPKLILPEDIVINAVEYRPIYVSGDVARPGEYVFRPGMTVRQAIAISGSYDLMRMRLINPFIQASDFRSDHEALWAELAAQQARIWRLRTELGEQGTETMDSKVPISTELRERLMSAEAEHLKARMVDRQKDKSLLEEATRKANAQLVILAEKKKQDTEGNAADMDDFQKAKELFQKGMTPTTRLSDARRAALMSSNQLLQTIVEMSNLERQRGEFTRQLEKIDNQGRIDAWRELQDANLRVAQITARLRGTNEKLMYAGLQQSQLNRGTGERPHITVYRKGASGTETITADEDLELAPGDVVEVLQKNESLAGLPQEPKAQK
jgi:polysaccharide biosynthesis/export protein